MQTSADVVLLSASAVTVRDLFSLAGSERPVAIARWLTLLYGGLGLAVALALDASVLEALRLSYSLFAAGIILPCLFALAPPALAPSRAGAVAAMLAGGGIAAAGRFASFLPPGLDPVIAGTAACGAILLGSLAWRRARGSA
jgi:Na+/proline symporter